MDSILKIQGLTKKYQRFTLENLDFEVKKNSIVGFIGANGAGKTTTIKLILGLIHADAGKIIYFNDNSNELNFKQIKNKIGVVLDDACFYEEFTLNNMKKLIASAYMNWDEEIYINYLNRFNLDPKSKISSLSKGMKVKFSLALALSHHAELLVMDEPSSGLDPIVRKELNDILVEYVHEKNNSVFFSSHITSDLDRIADTIICVDHGKVRAYGNKADILEKYICISGKTKDLSGDLAKKFKILDENNGFFNAICENIDIVTYDYFEYRKPNIEDVMLYFVNQEAKRL